jgi:hypothetical protein
MGSDGRFKFIPEILLTEILDYFLLLGITESEPMPILLDVRILGSTRSSPFGLMGAVRGNFNCRTVQVATFTAFE